MNHFTKEELILLKNGVEYLSDRTSLRENYIDRCEFAINKLQSLIDNYCEHAKKKSISDLDYVIACQECGAIYDYHGKAGPEQKYKDAWYVYEGKIAQTIVLNKEGYIFCDGTDSRGFGRHMYPSKSALIEARIAYWREQFEKDRVELGASGTTESFEPYPAFNTKPVIQNPCDNVVTECDHEYKKTLAKCGMYFIDMCHKCHRVNCNSVSL